MKAENIRIETTSVWVCVFTIPGIEHVHDEIVDEWDLGFRNAAGIPVKHWHDNRKTLSFLLVSLGKEGDRKYRKQWQIIVKIYIFY